jgi:hypothetical protein
MVFFLNITLKTEPEKNNQASEFNSKNFKKNLENIYKKAKTPLALFYIFFVIAVGIDRDK